LWPAYYFLKYVALPSLVFQLIKTLLKKAFEFLKLQEIGICAQHVLVIVFYVLKTESKKYNIHSEKDTLIHVLFTGQLLLPKFNFECKFLLTRY